MPEQTFDLRRVLWLMRGQRTIVAACVLVGTLIPTTLMLLRSKSYTATSIVLVPTSAASTTSGGSTGSGNGNVTDSALAVSSAVLGPAGSKAKPPVTPQAAQNRVNAAPLATNLVKITATGSSPQAAETLANAVADQLVVFVTSSNLSNASSALTGLQAQAAQLTKQVNKYDQEIQVQQAAIQANPDSAIAQTDTQLLASLTTAQANTALLLQNVNSQIASAKLSSAATNGGTAVIQHALSAAGPSLLTRLVPIVIGAVLGLFAGAVIVILRQRDSKLTTRDEIAAVAGVPVVLSLRVKHLSRSSEWLTLLREHEPVATELWNVRRVLDELDTSGVGGRVLTVITLIDDRASMAALTHLAVASAAMDISTSLVLTSDDPALRGLNDACDLLTARGEAARPNLRLIKGSSSLDEAESALTFISIVLNPDQPKFPAFVARGEVMMAISAGSVGQDQLARVLIAVGQEGLSVRGLFVTNPMSGDRSSGSLTKENEQVKRFLQSRALEPRAGGADVR